LLGAFENILAPETRVAESEVKFPTFPSFGKPFQISFQKEILPFQKEIAPFQQEFPT